MGQNIALTNSQVVVNGITYTYVPNTLDVDPGRGEQDVKATGGGGGSSETVYFKNVESNIGMVKFELYTRDVDFTAHDLWKSLGNLNVILVIDPDSDLVLTYQNMANTNLVSFPIGNDKTVPFEFKGNPAIY
jgi:hypothetical protein